MVTYEKENNKLKVSETNISVKTFSLEELENSKKNLEKEIANLDVLIAECNKFAIA